jgi:F0F1-type ATP synthase assembly protein I
MGVTIAVCVWAGKKMDEFFTNRIPAATITLAIIGIGAALYAVIKETKR